jgi:hypothetical protein
MAGRSLLLAALALALPAAAVLAADPPAQPTPPTQQPRLICRGGERQLGSHVRSTRRCRTAQEWRQEEEEQSRIPMSVQTTAGQNDGHAPANPR